MKHLLLGTAAIALVLTGPAAHATTVSFGSITATWQDVVPPVVLGLSTTGNGTGVATVFWGVPQTLAGKSGYEFTAPASQPVTVVVPPSPSGDFDLGALTVINEPIDPPPPPASIAGIRLAVTSDVTIGGHDLGDRTFLFDFKHDETPNQVNPCAYGGANGQGVNINGCADGNTVSIAEGTSIFDVDGIEYTVDIRGFELPDHTFTTDFLTPEEMRSGAQLMADVVEFVPHVIQTSEPEAFGLLAFGLFAMWGWVNRGKRGNFIGLGGP